MNFPENPTDGMVFESSKNVFFQYSTKTNSWSRILSSTITPLATINNDGLMSFEDYIKLTEIMLPPPTSTLTPVETVSTTNVDLSTTYSDETIEGCKTFSGITTIVSNDKFFTVDFSDGNIHGATAQINFDIDTDELIRYLENTGQFKNLSPAGEKGPQGDAGDPGLDALPVGPYGPDGADGEAFWNGSLVEETVTVRSDGNKAIVNIISNQVSDDENYIIVERGTIGNPNACPDAIFPQDVQSPWILVIKPGDNNSDEEFVSGPVNMDVEMSTGGSTKCGIVNGSCGNILHYFNIEIIINSIYDEWLRQLLIVKSSKEQEMESWLTNISTLFEQQKAALCCALEAVASRRRNQATRQYIESQAIAALGANRTLTMSDNPKMLLSTDYTLYHLSDSDCDI